jgi:O-antigen/teichoic acid export membrane protein
MSLAKKAFKGFMWNHFGKIFEYILLYLFSLFVARNLGPEKNGLYITFTTIVQMALVFGALGIDEMLNKYVAKLNAAGENLKAIYLLKRSFFIRILSIFFLCITIFFLKDTIGKIFNLGQNYFYLFDYVIILIFLKTLINFLTFYSYSIFRTAYLSSVMILSRFFELAMLFLIISNGINLRNIFLILVLGGFFSLFLLALANFQYFLKKGEKFFDKNIYNYSLSVWFNNLVGFFLFKHLGILAINYFLKDPNQVSYYDVAINVAMIINYSLSVGMRGVVQSSFSEARQASQDKMVTLFEGINRFKVFMTVPLFTFAYFFSHEIFTVLYGAKFTEAVYLFQIIALISIAASFSGGGLNPETLFALDKERMVLQYGIFGSLGVILLFFILIPLLGIVGAIWATYLGNQLAILLMLREIKRTIKIRIPWRLTLKMILISFIACGSVFLIKGSLNNNPLINLLILGTSALILFGLCLIFIKPFGEAESTIIKKIFPGFSRWENLLMKK